MNADLVRYELAVEPDHSLSRRLGRRQRRHWLATRTVDGHLGLTGTGAGSQDLERHFLADRYLYTTDQLPLLPLVGGVA